MLKAKIAFGGFIEAKIGGIDCVLLNGRWVRSIDHVPYDKLKIKDHHNV